MAIKVWNEPLIFQTIKDFKERDFPFLLGQKGKVILPAGIELAVSEPHYAQLRFQSDEGRYIIFTYDFGKAAPFPALMFANNLSLPPEAQAHTPIVAQVREGRLAYLVKLIPGNVTTLADMLGISNNVHLSVKSIEENFNQYDSLPDLPSWEDWNVFDWLNARNFNGNVLLCVETKNETFLLTNVQCGLCLVIYGPKDEPRKNHFFGTLEKIKLGQNLVFAAKPFVDDLPLPETGQRLEFSAVESIILSFPDWRVSRELALDPDVEYTFYQPGSARIYWSAKTFSILQLVQAVELMHQQCEEDDLLYKLCGKGFTYRFLEILQQYSAGNKINKGDIDGLLDLTTFFPDDAPAEFSKHLLANGGVKLIFGFLNCLLKELEA